MQATDLVLKRYEPSLRALYNAFAFGTGAIGHQLYSVKLLDFGEYMGLIGKINLIDTYISQREVRAPSLPSGRAYTTLPRC